MKTTGIILAVALAGFILLGGVIAVSMYIGVTNSEVRKLEHYEAKQMDVANVYDDTWKTISQIAQVSEEYRTSFDSIYSHIMSERYSKGDGTLMKWITESNPEFNVDLYAKLSTTIESKRAEFRVAQTELLDVARDYNTFIAVFPNRLFLSDKKKLNPKLILSTRTDTAIETGVDDDVELFKKK